MEEIQPDDGTTGAEASQLIGDGEIAFTLPLTPAELKLTFTALHSLLDDRVSSLPFGLGLLPDTLEHVFRQGDVFLGLHGGVKQLYRRAVMTHGALLVRSWTALRAPAFRGHADLAQSVPEIVPATGTILVIQRTPRNS